MNNCAGASSKQKRKKNFTSVKEKRGRSPCLAKKKSPTKRVSADNTTKAGLFPRFLKGKKVKISITKKDPPYGSP